MDNNPIDTPSETPEPPSRADDIIPLLLRLLRSRSRSSLSLAREVLSLSEEFVDNEEQNAPMDSDMSDTDEAEAMNTSNDEQTTEEAPRSQERYRLLVYIEERTRDTTPQGEEQAPTRYIVIIAGNHEDLQQIMNGMNSDDVINYLFSNYVPKGNPPAKKEAIDALPLTKIISGSGVGRCSVCLEEFEEGCEATVLPCKHCFHGEECVKPWLRMHNSCPVCRYEMPVEDLEYEQKRKQRMQARGLSEEVYDEPVQ